MPFAPPLLLLINKKKEILSLSLLSIQEYIIASEEVCLAGPAVVRWLTREQVSFCAHLAPVVPGSAALD